MNEELNELFDIKSDKNENNNIPKPKQNVLVHSIVRVVILVVATVATCGILLVAALDGQIGLAILAVVIILAWFGAMIFETVKLNRKKCRELANSNIILIVIAILIILGITAEIV